MSNIPGYDFPESEAAVLVLALRESLENLNKAVAFADANSNPEVVLPFKLRVAEIMFDIGWEVLEQGFYKKYPDLRPLDSSLRR